MDKGVEINQSNFSKMLEWLDDDLEKAGQAYESIRIRLTKIFYARGCHTAEELADETIDRVTKKMDKLIHTYKGNPKLYFYGVAKNVFLEHTRKPVEKELPFHLKKEILDQDELEQRDECLTKCLKKLPKDENDLIINYYKGEKRKKIENRQKIMEDLDLTPQNLRIRAYRIRTKLQKCLIKCLG